MQLQHNTHDILVLHTSSLPVEDIIFRYRTVLLVLYLINFWRLARKTTTTTTWLQCYVYDCSVTCVHTWWTTQESGFHSVQLDLYCTVWCEGDTCMCTCTTCTHVYKHKYMYMYVQPWHWLHNWYLVVLYRYMYHFFDDLW